MNWEKARNIFGGFMLVALVFEFALHDPCGRSSIILLNIEAAIGILMPPTLLVASMMIISGVIMYIANLRKGFLSTKKTSSTLIFWGLLVFIWAVIYWGISGYIQCFDV